MSPQPVFLRLPHPEGPVLVRVAPRPSTNSRPLDLDVRATDDVRAFVLPLQHSKISRYRRDGTSLSEEEWESCLASLLLGNQTTGHLHVVARFTDENLGIEVGRKVSGTTEIGGTLVLRPSKSGTKNADMFDWANEAVLRQSQLAEELSKLKLKHEKLERRVAEETARFRDLQQVKAEFESEHDLFFRDLLNEKKLKIRTQEHILATAHVDEAKLAALKAEARAMPGRSGDAPTRPPAVASSGKGKRKAESGAEGPDDGDVDKMDVDNQSGNSDDAVVFGVETDDDETASEPEPEPGPKPKSAFVRSLGGKKAGGGSSPPASKPAARFNKPPSSNLRGKSLVAAADEDDDETPAPRAFLLGRKPKPVPDPADDESTASEN